MNVDDKTFDDYLTRHYSHVINQASSQKFRARRKAYFLYNYRCLLPANREARILEIGPGYGELLELLAKDLAYTNFAAVDLSQEVVDFCNGIVPGIAFAILNTEQFLEDHGNCFDCVFMIHVLEHIPKARVIPLLQAIRRSLAPQGKLIIEVPNMANPFISVNMRYADFTHESGFTEMSLRQVLGSAGYSKIETFSPKLPWDHPGRIPQVLIRFLLDGITALIYRAYSFRRPKVLSATLSATATRHL